MARPRSDLYEQTLFLSSSPLLQRMLHDLGRELSSSYCCWMDEMEAVVEDALVKEEEALVVVLVLLRLLKLKLLLQRITLPNWEVQT